jgi:integrase
MTRQQAQSQNHPQPGSIIAADPLRTFDQVKEVKEYLGRHSVRDLAMFTFGVNTNLRASDIVRVTVGDVHSGSLTIREQKTGKVRRIGLNDTVMAALQPLRGRESSAPLFASAKGGGFLTVSALSRMVKWWCEDCGFKGNFSAHTMRKTWAFFQYFHFGTDIVRISDQLNHSSVAMTYRYLGITPREVSEMYAREI